MLADGLIEEATPVAADLLADTIETGGDELNGLVESADLERHRSVEQARQNESVEFGRHEPSSPMKLGRAV